MSKAARWLAAAAAIVPAAGTLLSLTRHPHWIFRLWDFPRVQMAVVAVAGAASYYKYFYRRSAAEKSMLIAAAAAAGWQVYKIHPYTPLVPKQVRDAKGDGGGDTISLLMSNVLMENEEHDRLIETVRRVKPDILLAVEVNQRWLDAIEPALAEDYPFRVEQPQENYYGMVLYSRLELANVEVKFLVQDDIPSIHATVRLESGTEVQIHALHPRPPEPLRDQRSTPRDAELVLVGRHIGDRKETPAIVAGDLNDVAWSETSQLFVRLSGLLDPRVGRGFYNSYNAKNPLFRFPLDHVFHSNHFELVTLRRLESIGSDHFPIYAELRYAPQAAARQEPSEKKAGDDEEASERLEKQSEDAATGEDRPSRE